MDQRQITKQILDFNKTAFDNAFSAMTVMQEQTERLFSNFMDKATWMPEEGKKTINNWIGMYKKGRDDFKTSADEGYKKVTDFFSKAAL